MEKTEQIQWEDFEKVDIRVGRVVEAEEFPEGKYSSHILQIDFGAELGVKKSLARLVPNYAAADVIGKNVLAVVNFEPRQIGKHMSEVLTLGVPGENDDLVLIEPERNVPPGGRLY